MDLAYTAIDLGNYAHTVGWFKGDGRGSFSTAKVITTESAKAQEALGEALPALEAAAEALKNLDKADITEIKQFTTPPEKVQSVVMCVMILKPGGKEKESDGWKGGKVMMSQGNFLKSLHFLCLKYKCKFTYPSI